MKLRVGIVLVLLVLAGCSAPVPDSTTTTQATTERPSTPTTTHPTTTTSPTGLLGNISATSVTGETVWATVTVSNSGSTASNASIAIRFVENDSFAKVGTVSVEPGQTQSLNVGLPTYGDDPRNLTVQFRIDGEIVAERPAVSD